MTKKYITRNHRQKAVLWKASGFTGFAERKVKAPVEIDCRWEEIQGQTIDAQGNPIKYDGTVFVSCDIPEESILWLGRIMDKPADADITYLREVIGTSETPNIKGTKFEKFVMVKTYKNKLPTLV